MASGVNSWSTTAASNATADSTINMAEGMPPSAVNDGVRALMARIADWRDSLNGSNATTGGTTAYVLTSDQSFAALAAGLEVAFQINATNTGTSTLNVDSLGAKPLRSAAGVEVVAGALKIGAVYRATYFTSNSGEWLLHDCTPTIIASDQVVTASILNKAVTLAKLDDLATQKLIGRNTGSTGVPEAVSILQALNWLLTTRGDTIRRGASDPERVALGASGYVWTSDGTDAVWAAPKIARLSQQTASSVSEITFTGLSSSYRRYRFELENVVPAADGQFVCEVSDDNGSTWKTSSYQWVYSTVDSGGVSGLASTSACNLSNTVASTVAVDSSTSYGWNGVIEILDPSNTTNRKTVTCTNGSYLRNGAVLQAGINGSGFWDGGNGAITAIRFRFLATNIASGEFTQWGIV